MSAPTYPVVAVFLDGTTPSDGSEPLLPYAQQLGIAAGSTANVVVSCIGQNGTAYPVIGTMYLSLAGTIIASGTLASASSVTLGITATQTSITSKVYPYSMEFVATTGSAIWAVVPESIFAILPNEHP